MQKDIDTGSVKPVSVRLYWLLSAVACIVIADEIFKYQGLQRLPSDGSLIDPGLFTLAIHKNFGVAFNIPFQMEVIIVSSVIIGAFLVQIAYKNWNRHPDITFATLMIILGALGNLYDRIVYGFTVDYIILFGRSAINLSDVVIVSGVVLLLLASRRTKAHAKIHPDEPID